jgi:hypothetical protein
MFSGLLAVVSASAARSDAEIRMRGLVLGVCCLVSALLPGIAPAAEAGRCLSRQQQRAMAAAHSVTPLSKVMRTVKKRYGGEVLRVRLCQKDEKLVYLLTVLARDGKVVRTSVDAASGRIAGGP